MKYIKYLSILTFVFLMPIVECSIKGTIFRKFNAARHGIISLFYKMQQTTKEKYEPLKTQENFNSIAGMASAKEDLQEIINVFNNPEKFQHRAVKLPRGIVLIGDSGNGKTAVARTIAGETKHPFFMISGEIAENFSNIKELSEVLKKQAPCILFIDSLDKAPNTKITELFHELDEHDHTKKPIIILGAMGNMHACHPHGGPQEGNNNNQLFKSGRFEQQIHIEYPDLQERKEIIAMYLKNISIAENISIEHVAKITYGFSIAEIIKFISKASLLSLQKNKTAIDINDFEEAHDRMLFGKKDENAFFSQEQKKLVAYHEAGHALILLLTENKYNSLHKVSIVSRDHFLGATFYLSENEKAHLRLKEDLEKRIMMAFGGHAAEELVFGTVSNGAGSDFINATLIITNMIMHFGMSDAVGKIFAYFSRSEHMAKIIDEELQKMAQLYYQKTKKLLIDNREKLDLLAVKLLEKETLYADEVYQLLNMNPPVKTI